MSITIADESRTSITERFKKIAMIAMEKGEMHVGRVKQKATEKKVKAKTELLLVSHLS